MGSALLSILAIPFKWLVQVLVLDLITWGLNAWNKYRAKKAAQIQAQINKDKLAKDIAKGDQDAIAKDAAAILNGDSLP